MTMVCITVQGIPVIGIIHKPFSGETFWAWSGHGHNLQHGPKTIDRKAPIIPVSTATTAFGDQISVIPAGGAGYKVFELVMGKVDAYLHMTKILPHSTTIISGFHRTHIGDFVISHIDLPAYLSSEVVMFPYDLIVLSFGSPHRSVPIDIEDNLDKIYKYTVNSRSASASPRKWKQSSSVSKAKSLVPAQNKTKYAHSYKWSGIVLDKHLSFDLHIKDLCRKLNCGISTLWYFGQQC